ncbi:hypothetical protein MA16_Dca013553 [Dendrobium catenatum]|uniref:Uncharacterized protein n=1 Tax=Dendrobium catenatum TaxID=906689 RepID=A0A2I0VPR9_9ASPA|nr:hypothetical protein MA16_Dca013553 [Dendrobium catenatum]
MDQQQLQKKSSDEEFFEIELEALNSIPLPVYYEHRLTTGEALLANFTVMAALHFPPSAADHGAAVSLVVRCRAATDLRKIHGQMVKYELLFHPVVAGRFVSVFPILEGNNR